MANITRRTWKNGKVTYRALVRVQGNPPKSASFDRLVDAKRWVTQIEADLRAGRFLEPEPTGAPEAPKHTAAELIDRYLEEVLGRKSASTVRNQTQQLAWWRKRLADLNLEDLTPALLASCRDELAKGKTPNGTRRTPATVNRYLTALSHVLTMASREWEWMTDNPLLRVTKPREPSGRVRFLSEEERDRLLEACARHNPALRPVVMLGLYSGMRLKEIMGLRWRDVDLERRRVVLADPERVKNRERRQVPLIGPLVEVLTAWLERQDPPVRPASLVFPSEQIPSQPIDLRKAWEKAIVDANLENFRFHDTRHCTASYLAMSGATPSEIAEVLGHKTLSMVKRYAHLSDTHTQSVMDRMGERFAEPKATLEPEKKAIPAPGVVRRRRAVQGKKRGSD